MTVVIFLGRIRFWLVKDKVAMTVPPHLPSMVSYVDLGRRCRKRKESQLMSRDIGPLRLPASAFDSWLRPRRLLHTRTPLVLHFTLSASQHAHPRNSMPIDIPQKKDVGSAISFAGEPVINASSSRPLLARISTASSDDGLHGPVRPTPFYPSFGTVVEGLAEQDEGMWTGEADSFKPASAPERTSAFPHSDSQATLDGPVVLSPAQSFLSMFLGAPPVSAPLDELDGIAGYTFIETIGHGGFSTVRKAASATGEVVAVKMVKEEDIERQDDPEEARLQLNTEVDVWSTLNHEHILPLFHVEHTAHAHYIVTLYCPAGSLFDILKRDGHPALPQDDAGMMFRQVVRGLRYLHETAKVIHRDIKLENILVDEAGMCRIGDFGFAKQMQDDAPSSSSSSVCQCNLNEPHERLRRHSTISHAKPTYHVPKRHHGSTRHRKSTPFGTVTEVPATFLDHQYQPGSLPYAAPELLSPPSLRCGVHPHVSHSSPAQDMWALGVLLYALLTGSLPFWDSFEPRLQMKILHGTYDIPSGIGHGAERVLRGCLNNSVISRWTVAMVDEVAWGVGWGSAGDVTELSPTSPTCDEFCAMNPPKSRSVSRSRPYPELTRGRAAQPQQSRAGIPSEHAISTSFSRSRTRGSRAHSFEREPPLSPIALSHSNSNSSSSDSSSYQVSLLKSPPPRVKSRGGSQSQSRSRSWSLGPPTTPPDARSGVFSYPTPSSSSRRINASRSLGEKHCSPIDEGEEQKERGRRRNVSKRDGGHGAAKDGAEPSSLDQDFLKALVTG